MPWNYGEIRDLCNIKNVSFPEIYLESLAWKHWKTKYHAEQAQKVWNRFKSAHPKGYEIGGRNQEWWDTYYASFAETEATIQALNEEADIVAQIVNQLVLEGYFTEEEVALGKVLDKLKTLKIAPNVVSSIEAFRSSKEFDYINAFSNTVKHRSLVRKQWCAQGGEDIEEKEGVRFLDFEYKPRGSQKIKHFPAMWISEVNTSYRNALEKYIKKIGE